MTIQPASLAVFHSVVNKSGASKFLCEEILPRISCYDLVVWWEEGQTVDRSVVLRKGGGKLSRSRLQIFFLQFLYILRLRSNLEAVVVNSVSNLGAIAGCLMLPKNVKVDIFVHERPIGKWRLSFFVMKFLSRASVHTVSPFHKAELQEIGIMSEWKYPILHPDNVSDAGPTEDVPDLMFVVHPDMTKGYELALDLIEKCSEAYNIVIYISRKPPVPIPKKKNVQVHIGKELKLSDYKSRLMVVTSNPFVVKETFSYITAESLNAGIPVVCFPSGGISEQIIHEVNGYFAKEYSAESFKDAIDVILGSSQKLETLRSGARAVNEIKRDFSSHV